MDLVTADEANIGGGNITIDGRNSTRYSFAFESSSKYSELSVNSQSGTPPSDSSPTLSINSPLPSSIDVNINYDKSTAEKIYLDSNMSISILCVLAMGLKDGDGSPILDPTAFPWTEIKSKKKIIPNAKDILSEINRRINETNSDSINPVSKPKPTWWDKQKKIKWLNENPITAKFDVQFVRTEVSRVKHCLLNAKAEKNNLLKELNPKLNWRSDGPCHIRLIHAVVENKDLYLKRNDPLSRTQLDARNSNEHAEANVWEAIADLYNSPEFNPSSIIMDCHSDYHHHIDITYKAVDSYIPASAERVKERLTGYRTGGMRVITKWEASGQGDGGSTPEGINEFEFGRLTSRPSAALGTRAAFLQDQPSHVLYLWEYFDSQGMLASTLNRLADSVAVLDGSLESVSSVVPASKKKKKNPKNESDEDDDIFVVAVTRMEEVMERDRNHSQALYARERIDCLQDHLREFRHRAMMARLKGCDEEEEMLKAEIEAMKVQLQFNKEDFERCNKRLEK